MGNKLENKTPDEWLNDLIAIADFKLRCAVAKIIWWDYYSNTTDGCADFDDLLKFEPDPPAPDYVIEGLRAVGYTKRQASKRVCKEVSAVVAGKRRRAKHER